MAVAPVDAPYIPAKYQGGDQDPSLSVIHSTVGPTKAGSARAIARYGQNPSSPSSWHYAIDAAEVIQSVHDHTVAYHCGFNSDSLAYEMCDNPSRLTAIRWLGRDHKAMLDRTARAVARNHAAYGIPVRFLTDAQLRAWNANGRRAKDGGIVTHDQMSRVFKRSSHWDPGKWPAAKFLTLVKKYHAELTAPPSPPVTTHTRWAIRETGVHVVPGGERIRNIPAGYKFQVIDGSGHGNDGWIETAAGNWVLGADTTTRDPALPATIKVGSWNIRQGKARAAAAIAEMKTFLADKSPDLMGLQECYDLPNMDGVIPGYSRAYQAYGFPPENEGYIEEHSENVILVKDGLELKVEAALEMEETWKGPNLGVMHDPRIHRRVTVLKDGVIWRFINFHMPFGTAAMAESNAAALECLETFPADEPVIEVGDFNQTNSQVVTRVGAPGGAVVDGGGIDLAVFRDCRKVKGENLGNFGSDHPVKIWTFEA